MQDKVDQLESTKWITDAKFDYFARKISASQAEIAELKKADESHAREIRHLHKKYNEEPKKEMTIKPEPSKEVEMYWVPHALV